MKLPSLKAIIAASIILFLVHAMEEYYSGFPEADRSFLWIVKFFEGMSDAQAVFVMFQICVLTLLIVLYAVLFLGLPPIILLIFLGAVLVLEASHIVVALVIKGYYPGLYTSLLFPVLSTLYWLRLLKDMRTQRRLKRQL